MANNEIRSLEERNTARPFGNIDKKLRRKIIVNYGKIENQINSKNLTRVT